MEKFYTYELVDPRDGLCFYVGKGKDDRIFSHEKKIRRSILSNSNAKLSNKISSILRSGMAIIYNKPYQNVSESQALRYEKELIDFHGIQNLCNLTHGGESGIPTDDVRKKLSDAAKRRLHGSRLGAKTSEETKAKMRLAALKRKSNKGYKLGPCSEEHRRKLSEAMSGSKNPHYGKSVPDERKLRISQSEKLTKSKKLEK